MEEKLIERATELANIKFEKTESIDSQNDFNLYNVDYYQRKLEVVEYLCEGEALIGNIKVKR